MQVVSAVTIIKKETSAELFLFVNHCSVGPDLWRVYNDSQNHACFIPHVPSWVDFQIEEKYGSHGFPSRLRTHCPPPAFAQRLSQEVRKLDKQTFRGSPLCCASASQRHRERESVCGGKRKGAREIAKKCHKRAFFSFFLLFITMLHYHIVGHKLTGTKKGREGGSPSRGPNITEMMKSIRLVLLLLLMGRLDNVRGWVTTMGMDH